MKRMQENKVVILMATYNGAEYVLDQIASLVAQHYSDWRLLIRDDGSCDATMGLIQGISRRDSRITVLEDEQGRMGVNGNFHVLLHAAYNTESDYFLLSDQDDMWSPDKMVQQLHAMTEQERLYPAKPVLIHSDLMVVDQLLGTIHDSFMQYQGIQHETDALPVLLTQNFVTGCTMMINRKLLDIALPIPKESLMHDWWLALCAAVFGHIAYIDEPLVKYRQHPHNEVGAKHLGDFMDPVSGKWKRRWYEGRDNLFKSMRQAEALADRIREHDPRNPNLALVEAYAALQNMPPLKRIRKLHQLGIHAQSKPRQALLLSRLLLTSKTRYG